MSFYINWAFPVKAGYVISPLHFFGAYLDLIFTFNVRCITYLTQNMKVSYINITIFVLKKGKVNVLNLLTLFNLLRRQD